MAQRRINYRVKIDHPFRILKRILSYVWKINTYKIVIIIILLLASSISQVYAMSLLRDLIDKVLPPLIENPSEIGPLITFTILMGSLFLVSIITSYLYQFILVFVTQDTLKKLRDDMFKKMETLPLNYFGHCIEMVFSFLWIFG